MRPGYLHILNDVWMEAAGNRASVRNPSQAFSVAVVRGFWDRYIQVYLDTPYSTWIAGHMLQSAGFDGQEVEVSGLCVQSHRRNNAGAKT
jgi:hypothetical protein